MSAGVIIAAAGSGNRMGGVYKPLERLNGREMLLYSLDVFEKNDQTAFVVISAREDKMQEVKLVRSLLKMLSTAVFLMTLI